MFKPIILSHHALTQMLRRGTTPEELQNSIKHSTWKSAGQSRYECTKNFDYNQNWNNKHYLVKQVRPIFVEENERIVVVTVYVYYF